ncbi:MAG: GNAT family protein [Arachnia propionica]|uniref:GNAT family N-acetyltransferase n=1 Tax=Arachnia propionica TaxID=1750 RepID=UPI0026F882FC|nr:GNAT family protein [Arachnia propionica]
MTLTPVTLTGNHVELVPLHRDHHDELCDVVRDGELWHLWFARVPSPETMADEITRRLELQDRGVMLPFTVRSGDRIAGMTTYCNIDATNKVLEVGHTFLGRSHQGGHVNPEMKLLLLRHAFETLGYRRVELRTHSMNLHSRAAIEKLGATLDGILRRHTILPNGTVRDTCVYSILDHEWENVRTGLEFRLRHRG